MITLKITRSHCHEAFITGFIHLWAMYVTGFNQKEHCQRCLRGKLSSYVRTKHTKLEEQLFFCEMDQFDSLYICGTANGPIRERYRNNLHLALEPCDGATVSYESYD